MRKVMTTVALATGLALGVQGFAVAAQANTQGSEFTPAQKKAIDHQIREYLLSNPDILVKMSRILQRQMMQQAQQKALDVIMKNPSVITGDQNTPVMGDKKGKVTLVEFFDYQCSVCEEVFPFVKQIMKDNPNLRVVFRPFPIFGPVSVYAAKAGLASLQQGKYLQFHNALFAAKHLEGSMKRYQVRDVAKQVGLDVKNLEKTMQDDSIKAELGKNYQYAQALAMRGTPAFIIAPTDLTQQDRNKVTFIPGGAPAAVLQAAINKAK